MQERGVSQLASVDLQQAERFLEQADALSFRIGSAGSDVITAG
jgi:hypothetical protein